MNRIRINNRWRIILFLLLDRSWASIEDILPIVPNLKYARRIMQSLIKNGLVKFVQCNFEENKKGPGKNFYALTKKGYRQYFSTEDSFHEPKILTSTGFYHTHIINTFLTGFSVLSKKFPGLIIESAGEKEMRRICAKLIEKNIDGSPLCIPDFSFCVGDGIKGKLFLAEADANTETISKNLSITIQNKFIGIQNAVSLGLINLLSERFSIEFRGFDYLHIAAFSDFRVSNIIECVKKNSVPYPVLITTFQSISKSLYESILEPVFYHAQSDKQVSILEEI